MDKFTNKINRRDKKRKRRKYGMKVTGKSTLLLMQIIQEKANKALKEKEE
jgi:hypothetical protein